MSDPTEVLQYEVRRLRDIVERQYLELAWQQSELRTRGGSARVVRFGAGKLARQTTGGNASHVCEVPSAPPLEAWPIAAVTARPLIPNTGFASYTLGRESMTVIGISVCGLDDGSADQIAGLVEERLRRARNFRAVFLMDTGRTEIFRRRGFAYEYIPDEGSAGTRQGRRFAALNARRIEFLKRKWEIAGIINFGIRNIAAGGDGQAVPRSRTQLGVSAAVDAVIGGRAAAAARRA